MTALVFTDLSQAADTLNHSTLTLKLNSYGIWGPALNWPKSYLSDHKQTTRINNSLLSVKSISFGVPQCSILGLLLFLISFPDIPNISISTKSIIYVDDCIFPYKPTWIYLSSCNGSAIIKLSLNIIKKQRYIVFRKSVSQPLSPNVINIFKMAVTIQDHAKILDIEFGSGLL